MKYILILIITIMTFSLIGCETIDRITDQRNEKECLPGTDCWNALSPAQQNAARRSLLMERQNQQLWEQNTHARAYSTIRSTQTE